VKRKKLKTDDFFCVKTHHCVFDVSNEEHKVLPQFILVALSIWQLVLDLIIYFTQVKLEAKQVLTLSFKPAVHIRSTYSWLLYFQIKEFR
jgi:hypothetical protein